MTAKSRLRKKMRRIVDAITPAEVASISEKICLHLIENTKLLENISTIAVYSAHKNEIDLCSLHQLLPDKMLVYPLCHPDSRLSFHHVPHVDSLTPGMLNILEPVPKRHQEQPTDEIDLFLCPGLAFNHDGTRLGQGGGFYDRMLQRRKPSATTIGISMTLQVIGNIPSETHDICMDYLLTEEGFHSVN